MDKEIRGVGSVIALLWVVHAIDWMVPFDLSVFGLVPRTATGLIGIVTMPFLHGNLGHLMSNTVPLAILLFIVCGLRNDVWDVVGSIVIVGGVLLWCFGRDAIHVGASGLVYGLMGFLIASGFAEKKFIPIVVSLVVGFFYGSSLFFGVLPTAGASVSWDGHLCGAIAGVLTAYVLAKTPEIPQANA
ncbi:MAG: rhomboid family intramembrane serine protease [Planctomycetota bacterium]|nr:rhomboid family intramembrane serine protease [Planctomycetota bacterium]